MNPLNYLKFEWAASKAMDFEFVRRNRYITYNGENWENATRRQKCLRLVKLLLELSVVDSDLLLLLRNFHGISLKYFRDIWT